MPVDPETLDEESWNVHNRPEPTEQATSDEKVAEKVRQHIKSERDSHSSERMMIADLMEDILQDNGSADLMLSSLDVFADAVESWRKKVKEWSGEL